MDQPLDPSQSHPASKKSREDAVLAKAYAIKRRRERGDDVGDQDQPPKMYTRTAHWDFVIMEAQWMSKDVRQDRRWKKAMAFLFVHLIAAMDIKLRRVPEDEKRYTGRVGRGNKEQDEGRDAWRLSHRWSNSDAGAATRPGRNLSACSTQLVITPKDPMNPIFAWSQQRLTIQVSWAKTMMGLLSQKVDNQIKDQRMAEMHYNEEYEAAKAEYKVSVRESMVRDPNLDPTRAGAGLAGMRQRRTAYPAGVAADENATIGAAQRQWKTRRPEEVALEQRMHPDMRRSMHERLVHSGPQEWNNEDDRLLCCLMTEFSENMGLVADVYTSTRRLEGMFGEHKSTMARIRGIVQDRARAPAHDRARTPVHKDEARAFLQQSIPCSATNVRRYQLALQPVAEKMQTVYEQEHKASVHSWSELVVSQTSRHSDSQKTFLHKAMAEFGGKPPMPCHLLALRREQKRTFAQQHAAQLRSTPDAGGHYSGRGAGGGPPPRPGAPQGMPPQQQQHPAVQAGYVVGAPNGLMSERGMSRGAPQARHSGIGVGQEDNDAMSQMDARQFASQQTGVMPQNGPRASGQVPQYAMPGTVAPQQMQGSGSGMATHLRPPDVHPAALSHRGYWQPAPVRDVRQAGPYGTLSSGMRTSSGMPPTAEQLLSPAHGVPGGPNGSAGMMSLEHQHSLGLSNRGGAPSEGRPPSIGSPGIHHGGTAAGSQQLSQGSRYPR